MKTAISIPDVIYQDAERMAKRRGMSRSELYANAVAEYVNSERYMGVRERLDAVYGGSDPPDSRLDPVLAQLQTASLAKDEW
jgi:metal-responsive CopG/Arc/MetJ family transcriptional regulator